MTNERSQRTSVVLALEAHETDQSLLPLVALVVEREAVARLDD